MDRFKLTDSHLHLQDDRFSADLDAVMDRARAAGVATMACNGSSAADWPAVKEIAVRNPDVLPCFGLHPWYVADAPPDWLDKLETFLISVPSGLGETGLDRWIENRHEALQQQCFTAQLHLAARLDRPVTIHCVRAWGWMMDVLKQTTPLPRKMLFHSFGGSSEIAEQLARMGAYFSFAGNVLRQNAHNRRSVLMKIPRERLLLETDAPDIPLPRGMEIAADRRRNEPANLRPICEGVAEIVGQTPARLAESLEENARSFFGDLLPK